MSAPPLIPFPDLDRVLARDLAPLYQQVIRRPLEELGRRLAAGYPEGVLTVSGSEVTGALLAAIQAAGVRAQAIEDHLASQELLMTRPDDRRAYVGLMLGTARFLGASEAQIDLDRGALSRHLDWPAVRERALRRRNAEWRIEQIGVLVLTRWLEEVAEGALDESGELRAELLERVRQGLTETQAHALIQREYVDAAAAVLRLEGVATAPEGVALRGSLEARATDPEADTWVQCKALDALATSSEGAEKIARLRLSAPSLDLPDDIFVRRHVLDSLPRLFTNPGERLELLESVLERRDPSPHVRQGAVEALRYLEPAEARDLLTRLSPCDPAQEESPEVRAALTVPLAALSRAAKPGEEGLELWKRALLREPHPLPRDHLLSSLGDLLEELVGAERLPREVGEELLLECAHEAARAEWPLAQRRQIEDALERVAVTALGAFERFRETLLPALDALSCGQALRLEDDGLEPVDLGRLLSWAARTGEGLYAQETRDGFRIVSGPRRELRAWRLLHEARTPSPDKRTGFSHATGSRRPGTIRAHSMTLAEASPAGVPGEPVAIASEGGSRPFLPLVDDFYDCLRDGPSRLYSAQGIVSLAEPAGWRAQARAWLGLTLHYEALAGLREQCRLDNPEVSPAAFVERTRGLGFEVVFVPHLPQALSTAAAYFGALASAEDDAPLEQESRGGGA